MSTLFLGSSVAPLVLIHVVPVVIPGLHPDFALPSLSAPFVKDQLLQQSRRSQLAPLLSTSKQKNDELIIVWDEPACGATKILQIGQVSFVNANLPTTEELPQTCFLSGKKVPLVYLASQDPTLLKPWPCSLVGYCAWRPPHVSSSPVLVTEATLVRVLPSQVATAASLPLPPFTSWNDQRTRADQWRRSFLGDVDTLTSISSDLLDEVLHNHDQVTVEALTLRLSSLLSTKVYIGTTQDAFALQHKRKQRCQSMKKTLNHHLGTIETTEDVVTDQHVAKQTLLAEGSLIVHSPDHAAGKTLLVQSIARNRLNCTVHVIHPGPWIAKYGTQADNALESMLHSIVISAAAVGKPICIMLDHMDAFLPPSLSGRSGAGDALVPALNGIASLLKNLSLSLQRRSEYPFPTKNSVYNLGGRGGMVLPVRVCLVGIVTCPNDIGRSQRGDSHVLSTVLDSMVGGRFNLPPLSAMARVTAFQHSFDKCNIEFTKEALDQLPFLAAGAIWARGSAFRSVARKLRTLVDNQATTSTTSATTPATLQDVAQAFASVRSGTTGSSSVTFTGESNQHTDFFESVGGNVKAKQALEDALALDPQVSRLLRSFGMTPPSGVLLYGPPGCGKTLLARSVANLLQSNHGASTALGGAFISISASNIVRAEIGTSEKLVAASFETARANAPAVIFIDEFQAIFTERQAGMGSGRLSSTLLQCMDDLKLWSEVDLEANSLNASPSASNGVRMVRPNRILVLGATNTPWLVDKAFLRPGRFDRVVHVALPSLAERRAIVRVHVSRMRVAFSTAGAEMENLCTTIARKTVGFSGADLAALCRAAAVRCVKEKGGSGKVDAQNFLEALEDGDVRASSSDDLVEKLTNWHP